MAIGVINSVCGKDNQFFILSCPSRLPLFSGYNNGLYHSVLAEKPS